MKRLFLQTLLVAMALWPAAHYGLTQAYGVNPWKLFGFAMYTVPGPRMELQIIGERGGRGQLLPRRSYGLREVDAAARYFNYRAELGELASAAPLARIFLDGRPELEAVVIGVKQYRIDPSTALVVAEDGYRRFGRDGSSEPFELPAAR